VIVKVGSAHVELARGQAQALIAPRTLQVVLLGGACVYIALFIGVSLSRLLVPFPLEITEGASLETVLGLLRGQPLYREPTVQHVPMIYGPVYFYAAALVSRVTGPGFTALRVVSLLASLVSIGLVYLLVKHETESVSAGVLAAGLLAATYPLSGGALDLGRVDALALCLMLAALYACRLLGSRAALVAGLCAGVGVLTKQAMAPIAAALVLYMAIGTRQRLVVFSAALAASIGIPLLALEVQSGQWATLFLLQLPRQHQVLDLRLGQFWTSAILPRFSLGLLLGGLFIVERIRRGQRDTGVFYSLTLISMLGVAWISDANPGAADNVLLPACAILAIAFALGLHEGLTLLSPGPNGQQAFWAYGVGVGIFQLLLLAQNPRLLAPYHSDLWADQRLAATLQALPGKVYAPDFDAFMRDANEPEQPYAGSAAELLGGYGGVMAPAGGVWLESVRAALRAREYNYVVLDPESAWTFFKGAAEQSGFVDQGPLFPDGDEFWLWRTGQTPKAEVYVPKERLTGTGVR
jgi:hypothetical protein